MLMKEEREDGIEQKLGRIGINVGLTYPRNWRVTKPN